MFGTSRKQKSDEERVEQRLESIKELKAKHDIDMAELKQQHKLELQQKDFDLKHFKDDEVKRLRDELAKAAQEVAVLKKENQMLDKIVDLNADIIDIKNLVNALIGKLPTIDLKSLTINQSK